VTFDVSFVTFVFAVPVLCSRIMPRRLLLLLLTAGCVSAASPQTPAQGQPQLSPLTVTVSDEVGAVIPKALVTIRTETTTEQTSKPPFLELRTDSQGQAKAGLTSGFYDVVVALGGFAPSARKVRITEGQSSAVSFALELDEPWAKEHGDEFSPETTGAFLGKFFRTSDGAQIHYVEAGEATKPPILFIPGWTMPASIWRPQLEGLWRKYHVIAVDPRSQGASDTPSDGNYPERRSRDFEELMEHLQLRDVTLVGWSMGVPETLVYANQFGTSRLRALVLVDGFVALDPKDSQVQAAFAGMLKQAQLDRSKWTEAFVRSMYRKPQSEEYLHSIIRASLRTPTNTAVTLMENMATMGDLSQVLAKLDKPVLFAYEPQLAATAQIVRAKAPSARIENFDDAGHALFVDDAERFNKLIDEFVTAARH
jgi:non-heme chloroperoxidase